MEIILIIGVFQAVFLSGLIFTKKQRGLPDLILFMMFIVYALTLFLAYMEIYNRGNDYPYPLFINTSTPFIFLHGPLLWFYIQSLTRQQFRFKPKYLLHFFPFILIFILLSLQIYTLPPLEKILLDQQEAFKDGLIFPVMLAMVAFSTQGYNAWGLWLIGRYRQKIKVFFSELSHLDLKWLRFLIIASILFHGSISVLYILDFIFGFLAYSTMQPLGFSFAAIFVLVLGFYGHRQGNIFTREHISLNLETAIEIKLNTHAIADSDKEFVQNLLSHMKHQKPYLNPELTLGMLSQDMRVSAEYLSGILNGRLNKNFFDFINHYRIEAFKTLCQTTNHQKLTLMGLAYECGFNSKATFNRVFKKNTGLTPSEYLLQVSTN